MSLVAQGSYAPYAETEGIVSNDEGEESDLLDSEESENLETDAGTCVWKINPTESIYDLAMLRFLKLAQKANKESHWKHWRIVKVLVLLIFNGSLQLTVVARVNALVQDTRAERVDSVFAPSGNCQKNPPGLYSENPRVGSQEWNWDCGPMYPLLFANASFLDVNNDKFWSEADKPGDLGESINIKFNKHGDLDRIFMEFLQEAKELKFLTQLNENIGYEQSRILTDDFTRIPMKWMVDQQPISSLCNNVDPELCGNLEVRGILEEHFPNEPDVGRRVRKCRETWDWCVAKFGELFKMYRASAAVTCEDMSPTYNPEEMVIINRYSRADKYSERVNERAILSPIYQSFLLLVLIIWWLTVLEECRMVLAWWVALLTISGRNVVLYEDNEKIEVKAISGRAKGFILILVLLPRTIVIVTLSFVGTSFLITADSYSDLILNSVALGFLIEIDDMLFHGVASEVDKDDIGRLQPIEGKHSCSNFCISFVRGQTSILLLTVVFIIPFVMAALSYVMPFGKDELTEAYQCLCHMEGKQCIVAQLFGHEMEVPTSLLGAVGVGRAGKGR